MRRLHKLSVIIVSLTVYVSGLLADLQGDIKRILSDHLLAKTTVGIEVVRLTEQPGNCQVVYEQNARTLLTPASNLKILTTSAALHVLSPQFRFRTMLVKHGDDLVIWGDGDPTLGDAELMDQIGWSQTAVFDDWATQLGKRNIASAGNIVVDDSIFDDQFLHPRWEKHQFMPSGAQVGGLNFNVNTIEFTVQEHKSGRAIWSVKPATSYVHVTSNTCTSGRSGVVTLARAAGSNDFSLKGSVSGTSLLAATVSDPPMYAGTVFADLLRSRGMKITGNVIRDRTTRSRYAAADAVTKDQEWQILCIFETPLPSVITRCNKDSMNMYAEALCKRLSAASSSSNGSWQGGVEVVGEFLKQLGVGAGEFRLDDGSGLSRENVVTVNAIMHCLLHNYYSPYKSVFMDSLPIGGVDGTLRKRFDGAVRGRVFAKTGFIANVSALSGYLKTKSGEWYAFSILMNGIPDLSNSSIKPLQEQIVEAIDSAASDK